MNVDKAARPLCPVCRAPLERDWSSDPDRETPLLSCPNCEYEYDPN